MLFPHSDASLAQGFLAVQARVDSAIPGDEACRPPVPLLLFNLSQTGFSLKSPELLRTKVCRNVVFQPKLVCNQFYAALITHVNKLLQSCLNQAVRPEPAQQKAP